MSSTSIQIRIQACTQTNTSLGCISKWLQSAPTLGSPCSWSQMKCQDPATFVQNYLWNTIDSTSICSTCLRCTEDPRAFFSIPTKKKLLPEMCIQEQTMNGSKNTHVSQWNLIGAALVFCCPSFRRSTTSASSSTSNSCGIEAHASRAA